MSDAVRLFLRRLVIDQAFPPELNVPNVQTRVAMDESRAMLTNRRARFATGNVLFADPGATTWCGSGRRCCSLPTTRALALNGWTTP
jgi:hypothetical protein